MGYGESQRTGFRCILAIRQLRGIVIDYVAAGNFGKASGSNAQGSWRSHCTGGVSSSLWGFVHAAMAPATANLSAKDALRAGKVGAARGGYVGPRSVGDCVHDGRRIIAALVF